MIFKKKTRLPEVILLVALGILVVLVSRFTGTLPETTPSSPPMADVRVPRTEYGIPVDSLQVFRGRVGKNEFLSQIMTKFGVPYRVIDQMASRSRDVFDVRRMKAGNQYSVICTDDSVRKVCYFVYEVSPTSFVVFDIRDSVHVHPGLREIETRVCRAAGTISSSLWESMVSEGFHPGLVISLSEIYAWTVDFFGIQKGDSYRVIYEELYVEGQNIGPGRVIGADFRHMGRDFYAVYFIQDSVGDYYDEEGNSLRRTFLKAPLTFTRISSRFSNSRMHPILKIRRPHHGVDYAAPAGTPVVAVGDGVVVKAAWSGGSGKMVKIKHNSTYTTAYLHLSGFAKGIHEGAYVKQGDVIGYVGSTGLSTGPHLDFRFYRNGQPVDPLKVESPPAEPVSPEHLERYRILMREMMMRLDSVQTDQVVVDDIQSQSDFESITL
ncbi:MAG: peptidoglycan DD-metalloendopeptidase family protein [Bacteroidales bacterium]|nr:peptidoglycan DD-metalloendopeptidase family protein [Bacteroidales bacterium]